MYSTVSYSSEQSNEVLRSKAIGKYLMRTKVVRKDKIREKERQDGTRKEK